MSREYVIFTDASADVDRNIVKAGDVRFVPMHYTLGGEDRVCSDIEEEALLKKFYDGQRGGETTQTSQITPQQYIDVFEPYLKEGKSVLYLSLSSGLTKTYDSVCLAIRELEDTYTDAKVVAVDSLAATGGMGLLIEEAVSNRNKGMSIDDNAAWIEENRLKVGMFFVVDDLMYLKRGGRIPATTAVIGTALNIKPILEVDNEGKLITIDKKRGVKPALKELAAKYSEKRIAGMRNRVYIVHGDSADKADALEALIREIDQKADITKMMLSPIIGAHTGPGMAAVIFFGER